MSSASAGITEPAGVSRSATETVSIIAEAPFAEIAALEGLSVI